MKILLTGATGLVGKKLCPRLLERGHSLVVITRSAEKARRTLNMPAEFVECDIKKSSPPASAFEGVEAVIGLAGESVARRWNDEVKKEIRDSRVLGTRHLVEGMRGKAIHTFINASAIGYYGDRGDESLDESSSAGSDFLAGVCVDWEKEARRLEPQVRTICLRVGLVLSKEGGILAKLLPPFKMGVGGPAGNGKQWSSWIHERDLASIILHCLDDKKISGPVNGVAPNPVTNKDLAHALGKALHRPAVVPTPMFALRIAMGEMADVVVSSAKVFPKRMEQAGFRFEFSQIEQALSDLRLKGDDGGSAHVD